MLIAWRYRERDTIIQRLDPRARIIFMLTMLFSVIQFWDLRILLAFLASPSFNSSGEADLAETRRT